MKKIELVKEIKQENLYQKDIPIEVYKLALSLLPKYAACSIATNYEEIAKAYTTILGALLSPYIITIEIVETK